MISSLRIFSGKSYYPLNKIEISKKTLEQNYNYLKHHHKQEIAPVLKSNAYGHGIVQVAKILEQLNPPMFCVDSLFEAYELLKAKVKTEILIMGYINPENLKVKRLPFSYAAFDANLLKIINDYQPQANVHIKIDTGMHRSGILTPELENFLGNIKKFKNINIVGLMSHLAMSEEPNSRLNLGQIEDFKKAIQIVENFGFRLKWKHIAASRGLAYIPKNTLNEISNLARIGLTLYGIDQTNKNLEIKPALKLKSQIVQIKKIHRGDSVGYAGSFVAKQDMRIGVLPIGYYDGVDRRLSNSGFVLIDKNPCRIVGRISMNITTCDLSTAKNPKIGDEVIVFSDKVQDPNSIASSANLIKTIPYELLVHLSPTNVKRVVI